MELTTAIQSEQHVKKELARRMGELQEELHNVKEQVRSLTVRGLQTDAVFFLFPLVFIFLRVSSAPAGDEKYGKSGVDGAEGPGSSPPAAVLCWLPDPGLRERTAPPPVSAADPAHGPAAAR